MKIVQLCTLALLLVAVPSTARGVTISLVNDVFEAAPDQEFQLTISTAQQDLSMLAFATRSALSRRDNP